MDDVTEASDRELWDRAAAGEPQCFGEIFDRHAAAVHAYCRVRSSGHEDGSSSAADLVSIVFLEAWRRRRDVRLHEESALPWLLGVARRVLLHRARTARRHRAMLARLPPDGADAVPEEAADLASVVARRLDDRHRAAAVSRAFARLRTREREVLTLCVWGGLDHAAAAVALGVPVGTVKSRLSRARTRLRALTEAEERMPGAPAVPATPAIPERQR